MTDISRRAIFPLAGVAALTPLSLGATPVGLQLDPHTGWGVQLRLQLDYHKMRWVVPTIDWNEMQNYYPGGWRPGIAPEFKYIPLKEFIAQLNKELNLPPDV